MECRRHADHRCVSALSVRELADGKPCPQLQANARNAEYSPSTPRIAQIIHMYATVAAAGVNGYELLFCSGQQSSSITLNLNFSLKQLYTYVVSKLIMTIRTPLHKIMRTE